MPKRIMRGLFTVLVILAFGIGIWLYFLPPNLLKVGSGYAAKIVCSNVFIAGRDPTQVLAQDVQAPGHPLLRLMRVDVDRNARRVGAALLGVVAPSEAVYRDGLGCTIVPVGMALAPAGEAVAEVRLPDSGIWPNGGKVELQESVGRLLSDRTLTGPGMRAVVVVRDGRIAAEAYGESFASETPLLGWSMTKTVNAVLIGRLMAEGRISLDERNLFTEWRKDRRGVIRLDDLLAMEGGLAFNENYGTVADVTRMLFLETDMARFVENRPLEAEIGSRFSYSSGTSVILSRIWMDRLADQTRALAYPREALFQPLGMRSAIMEPDVVGTFVGSSYMYATARDWARFGLFLARDGVWNGERLLPEGFVAQMHEPSKASDGRYSKMQTWLPSDSAGLPADAFFLSGHDGQYLFVIPSMDLVIVRLGLTPRSTAYEVVPLVQAVAKAVGGT